MTVLPAIQNQATSEEPVSGVVPTIFPLHPWFGKYPRYTDIYFDMADPQNVGGAGLNQAMPFAYNTLNTTQCVCGPSGNIS